jgi:hypothetical protein
MFDNNKLLSQAGKAELSKSYIDAFGNVIFHETDFKIFLKATMAALKEFPPMAVFMLVGLICTECYILIGGIIYHTIHPAQNQDLKIYLFLFVCIGIAISSLILLGWLFIKNKHKSTISKTRYYSDLESYSLD